MPCRVAARSGRVAVVWCGSLQACLSGTSQLDEMIGPRAKKGEQPGEGIWT